MSGFSFDSSSKLQLDCLVIDSNAIIRGHGLDLYGRAKRIITVPEVLAEIRDSKAKELLERLPFELEIKNPSADFCRKVANFARTTGDFAALSKTDLKLVALTCMLEQEITGKCAIPETKPKESPAATAADPVPAAPATAESEKPRAKVDTAKTVQPGFSWAKITKGDADPTPSPAETLDATVAAGTAAEEQESEPLNSEDFPALPPPSAVESDEDEEESSASESDADHPEPEKAPQATMPIVQSPSASAGAAEACCSCHGTEEEGAAGHIHVELSTGPEVLVKREKKTKKGTEETVEKRTSSAFLFKSSGGNEKLSKEMREADDGTGWVNSNNFAMKAASDLWTESTTGRQQRRQRQQARKAAQTSASDAGAVREEDVRVACFTTDFSMQNVLLQAGLHVISAQGMLVRSVKKWILRCMACYTIQGEDMTRLFCSRCGASHLSRVAATIDHSGKLRLHLKKNYKVDTLGMKYSLPAPGKQDRFEGELLLREDQLLSGIWRQKVVKINKDVKSAFGEDVTSDVGIQMNKHDVIQVGLGKKNPNAQKGRERRGKKKT